MIGAFVDRCSFPSTMWRAIRAAGIEPSAILHAAGLPASAYLDPRIPFSTQQYFSIWRAVETLSRDCCFALRIIDAEDTSGHTPGFTAGLYAANFRDAINRLLLCKSAVSSERLWTREERGRWSMGRDWPFTNEAEPALSIDLTFAVVLELGRRGSGRPIKPLKIQLAREPSRCPALDAYYGCPIQFDARQNVVTFDVADLEIPFPGHNPEFLELVTQSLLKSFEQLSAGATLGECVKSAMKRAMRSGRPEVATIASSLGMSERTLQRRITEETTTYRELLIEARRELGLQLLINPHLNVEHIAAMLGFQSPTSFYRAFKDWEGMSPGEWRGLNAIVAGA